MGGLQFCCIAVEEPKGGIELTYESVAAMHAQSDPTKEVLKGGPGHIGQMVFSAGAAQLAVVAYVPEAKQSELSREEWLNAVIRTQTRRGTRRSGEGDQQRVHPHNWGKGHLPTEDSGKPHP